MQEKKNFSFSYLDGFLLLLAGLVLSVVIYFGIEARRTEENAPQYQVTVAGSIGILSEEWLPVQGDLLFDGSGNAIGEVLSIEREEGGENFRVLCLLEDRNPAPGSDFRLETKNAVIVCRVEQTAPTA